MTSRRTNLRIAAAIFAVIGMVLALFCGTTLSGNISGMNVVYKVNHLMLGPSKITSIVGTGSASVSVTYYLSNQPSYLLLIAFILAFVSLIVFLSTAYSNPGNATLLAFLSLIIIASGVVFLFSKDIALTTVSLYEKSLNDFKVEFIGLIIAGVSFILSGVLSLISAFVQEY